AIETWAGSELAAFFDPHYYKREYPDVTASDLLAHFCTIGWREGRNPNAAFDTTTYLALNPDVTRSGMTPSCHYLILRRTEDRAVQPAASPSARTQLLCGAEIVDWVARLRDLVDKPHYERLLGSEFTSGMDVVAHFAYRGWREGRSPRPTEPLAAIAARHPK